MKKFVVILLMFMSSVVFVDECVVIIESNDLM